MSTRPNDARAVVAAWDPAFRATMTIAPEHVDSPDALGAAAATLPQSAADLLLLLRLSTRPGEAPPDRLRPRIEAEGLPLWRMAALLTRAPSPGGGTLRPTDYAGACRLNPALGRLPLPPLPAATPSPAPSYPPSDARWDAIVLAAHLERKPAPLTMDGSLRRDTERRMWQSFGGDERRWALALAHARLTGRVRPVGGRLEGFPEAHARPIPAAADLFDDPVRQAFASVLARWVGDAWTDLEASLAWMRSHLREVAASPAAGCYPGRQDPWDDDGWNRIEAPAARDVADVLHRIGVLDAARDPQGGVTALRRPPSEESDGPAHGRGIMVLPDLDILVHAGDVDPEDYGRIARMAPWVEGLRMHRHRLSRDGVAADLEAGHTDPVAFLERLSRTGVPHTVRESLTEWQRSATRVVIRTGVDVLERDDGTLVRVADAAEIPPGTRAFDYTTPPRGRFLAEIGANARLRVPAGWDSLPVRALVARVARPAGREQGDLVYLPEHRTHADPEGLVTALRDAYGGELPGELEARVRAGGPLAPVTSRPARLVRLPATAAAALRRDIVAGPLLRRHVGESESLVEETDVAALRARLEALGIPWDGATPDIP